MKKLIVVLMLATACTVPQTSEPKENIDSVAMLSSDTLEMTSDEITPPDTVYTTLDLGGKFDEPQVQTKVGYVYAFGGLDVLSAPKEDAEKLGTVGYKARVSLKEDMKTGFVAIDFGGKTGYVMSDEILNLPVPETDDVIQYFTNTLMLMENPVERKNPEDLNDSEGMFSLTYYIFEGGFKIEHGNQYESGWTTVQLPGLTTRKGFLFASYFYESFGKTFQEFPIAARDEDLPEERHVNVQLEGSEVVNITVGNGEGCYWEDTISSNKNGCEMSTGGGC
jgi:hypothetical protein